MKALKIYLMVVGTALALVWSVYFVGHSFLLDADGLQTAMSAPLESYQPDSIVERVILNQEEAQISAIEQVSQAVVGVINGRISSLNAGGEGSGVIYRVEDGNTYIVTNEHVVAGADFIEVVMPDESRFMAELLGSDIYTDLAVLRLNDFEADTVAVFGNTEDLQIGQTVIAIGNPLGLNFSGSATSGIVSGHGRTIPVDIGTVGNQQRWEMTLLQTDAAINPGNSGGALINLNGEVVGINSMKIASNKIEGMSFSIPTYVALPVIGELESYGEVNRPFIGITGVALNDVSQSYRQHQGIGLETEGIYITSVLAGSMAESMGLQVGDVIVAIGEVEVSNVMSFRRELFNYRPGDHLEISVLRVGEALVLDTTVVNND